MVWKWFLPNRWLLTLTCMTCLISPRVHGVNLCEDGSDDAAVKNAVHIGAVPWGGSHAGSYNKADEVDNVGDCLESCCSSPTCDTVFFHDNTCYFITCNQTQPHACDPRFGAGKQYQTSVLINVKSPGEYMSSMTTMGHSHGDAETRIYSICSPQDDESCGKNAKCQLGRYDEVIGFICQCLEGLVVDKQTGNCVADTTEMLSNNENRGVDGIDPGVGGADPGVGGADPGVDRVNPGTGEGASSEVSCEVGILVDCRQNEHCVLRSNHSRAGVCQCLPGFSRQLGLKECIRAANGNETTDTDSTSDDIPDGVISVSTLVVNTSSSTTAHSVSTTTTSIPPASPSDKSYSLYHIASTLTPRVTELVVSAGANKEIQLPTTDVTLSAFVIPEDDKNEYQYLWSLLTRPDGSEGEEMFGINTDKLKLTKLVEGLYSFKVAVSTESKYGDAYVNVSVVPPIRENQPPVAVVKPVSQEVNQPNDVMIDASESHDDDKIEDYHWEQVNGPLESATIEEGDSHTALLSLKGLAPGDYRFKLTVTDSDGAQNSTFADVTVVKETDYPPKANAGSNQIIYLPQNSLTLYGNGSTDDKGIVSYEWIMSAEDQHIADMKGVRTPYLHLENLELGDYTFTLTVKDASEQTSSASVSVFVRPEINQKPVAVAGPDRTVWLPLHNLTLDGSNSTDDTGIKSYHWVQTKGGGHIVMGNEDSARASLTGLSVGVYEFQLTVADGEGKEDSDSVTITVKENANQAPQSKAGGNRVVTLPVPLVSLDGSRSTDDKSIVSYKWTRTDQSLAAGAILNGTDEQAVLQIANLVAGRYIFTLLVTDAEGLHDSDTASLIVQPEENRNDLIEIQLDTSIHSFTVTNQRSLESELALLLHGSIASLNDAALIHIDSLHANPLSDRVIATFHAFSERGGKHVVYPGLKVVNTLKRKISSNKDVLEFKVIQLETVVCQNNCSNHGYCDQNSKMCVCEAFWMQNFFRTYLIGLESNCDWSVLYVIIVGFLLVIALGAGIWAVYCFCRRCSRLRPKKRHRYQLLEDADSTPSMEMLPKGKNQSSSLMVSESDFSSEEETLFINKKTNGHIKNGVVKSGRIKVKT